jgi:hypothetical protein
MSTTRAASSAAFRRRLARIHEILREAEALRLGGGEHAAVSIMSIIRAAPSSRATFTEAPPPT